MGPTATGADPAAGGRPRPRPERPRPGPRRTNLALLIVLVVALATGGLAFAAGTGWGRPVVVARGLAGRSGAGRWASVAFGVLVLVAVAAGLAHATGALAGLGPVSAMQVHVGAALAALPLLA